VPRLPRVLCPGGLALFEIGHTQAGAVSSLLAKAGLAPGEGPWRDLAGRPRVVGARSRVKAP
jgi:release factor glutamine methyltransferase